MVLISQILLLIFFSIFFLFCRKNLFLSLNIIIFCLPLYLVRFSIYDIPTTALEIMIYIIFFVWFLNNLKAPQWIYRKWKFEKQEKELSLGILLLFCGVLFSTIGSDNLPKSLGIFKGFFVDPFLFFLVFVQTVKVKKQVIFSLLSLIFSSLLVSFISFYFAFQGGFTFDGRLNAFYESPNYLAMYISPSFLFVVYFFIFKRGLFSKIIGTSHIRFLSKILLNRIFQYLIILTFLSVIILTKSFGAVFGIFFAFILFLLTVGSSLDRKNIFKHKKYLALAIIFSSLFFGFLALQKYEQIANSEGRSSWHSRIMIWRSSFEMLRDEPFFGIGPGTFQDRYLELQPRFTPYLEWAVTQPHNSFLSFYLQTGLIGFGGFMVILWWFWKYGRRKDLALLFLFYFLFHSLVDTLYWKNDLAMIFWIMLGVVLVLSREEH